MTDSEFDDLKKRFYEVDTLRKDIATLVELSKDCFECLFLSNFGREAFGHNQLLAKEVYQILKPRIKEELFKLVESKLEKLSKL